MSNYGGKDFAKSFRTVRKNTIQVAQEIPDDQYGFRATPDTRTVAETLAHVAASTQWVRQAHGRDKKTFLTFDDFKGYMAEGTALEADLKARPKAQIIAALEREGEMFASWLETLSDETLAESVGFPPPLDPPSKTRFEMLLGPKEHEMHHRAQLMVVERLLGIVPHLTRARLARQA